MSLYISTALASSSMADTPMQDVIKSLAISIAREKQQGRVPAGPSLDVTFMLSDKNATPEFTGMRMGGYSPENNILYFEREVPENMVKSELAEQYVKAVMQDVMMNACDFFQQNNILFNEPDWKHLFESLAAGMTTK